MNEHFEIGKLNVMYEKWLLLMAITFNRNFYLKNTRLVRIHNIFTLYGYVGADVSCAHQIFDEKILGAWF
jgi:hypothetical protein